MRQAGETKLAATLNRKRASYGSRVGDAWSPVLTFSLHRTAERTRLPGKLTACGTGVARMC
jgi:hypothetical protein